MAIFEIRHWWSACCERSSSTLSCISQPSRTWIDRRTRCVHRDQCGWHSFNAQGSPPGMVGWQDSDDASLPPCLDRRGLRVIGAARSGLYGVASRCTSRSLSRYRRVLAHGRIGEIYNISGHSECENIHHLGCVRPDWSRPPSPTTAGLVQYLSSVCRGGSIEPSVTAF